MNRNPRISYIRPLLLRPLQTRMTGPLLFNQTLISPSLTAVNPPVCHTGPVYIMPVVTPRNQSTTTPSSSLSRYDLFITPSILECSRRCRRQCGPASDASQSDASWDDEFLIYGTQGKRPAFHLMNDALPPDISSIARGVGSPPLSESSSAASIPEGGQISAPPASISLAPNNVSLRSREDQHYRDVWTLPIASMVTPPGAIRYQDNDGEAAIVSSSPQESNHQASYKPRSIQRHRRVLPNFIDTSSSSSRSSPMYVGSFSAASPPFQGTPQRPSRYAKNRPEKEHWCPSCGAGFSKSQALGRHVKDMHKVKIPCIHCASFAWPRGRRYLYQRHLKMQHPQIIPPEVRRRVKIREP